MKLDRIKLLLVVFLFISVLCLYEYVYSLNNEVFEANVEALADSEGYSLGTCKFESYVGDFYVFGIFCDPETTEYLIKDCNIQYRRESISMGKCVAN